MIRTKARLREIVLASETLAATMRMPSALLGPQERAHAAGLLEEMASYCRLAFAEHPKHELQERAS